MEYRSVFFLWARVMSCGGALYVRGAAQRVCCVFFFFQAEDGIRDVAVTGVQTCALPISLIICSLTTFAMAAAMAKVVRVQIIKASVAGYPLARPDVANSYSRSNLRRRDRKSVV